MCGAASDAAQIAAELKRLKKSHFFTHVPRKNSSSCFDKDLVFSVSNYKASQAKNQQNETLYFYRESATHTKLQFKNFLIPFYLLHEKTF